MKANVAIEINDLERSLLADLIDGKVTKRMATRADIVRLCEQHIGGLIEQSDCSVIVPTPFEATRTRVASTNPIDNNPLTRIDPEDAVILSGKPEAYVIGWNRVKRGKQ